MKNIMPAKAPSIEDEIAARLAALGQRIRAERKRQKVSGTNAAEAAGMSRVTLHRIEHGEPSVTMGAYMNAAAALGLELDVFPLQRREAADECRQERLPARIQPGDYPELKRIAWQRSGDAELTPEEALNLYERNWRHVDREHMSPKEQALIRALVSRSGGGRLLV